MRCLPSLLLAVPLCWLFLAPVGDAEAQARHERVKVTPMKKAGKVIGARIKLTLRPDTYTSGAKTVRVGLGTPVAKPLTGTDFREMAAEKSKGYLVHQWKEEVAPAKPLEKTYTIEYGKGNTLKGGERLDLVSAWKTSYWHVWGMSKTPMNRGDGVIVTLPKIGP